jgi:hypothetical protein
MRSRTAARLIGPLLLALACTCQLPTLPFLTPAPIPTATRRPATPAGSSIVIPPAPIPADALPIGLDWVDRSPFEQALTTAQRTILSGLPGASVYHIALSLSDPPSRVIGIEEVHYTNRETVPLAEVALALFPEILGGSIAVSAVQIGGQEVEARRSPGFLSIPVEPPLEPGGSVVIHLEFDVQVPSRGGGFYYGIFGYNAGILSLAHAWPTILVYDADGWNNRTPDLDGDPLFTDASFYLVSVDAPAALALVAAGTEVQRAETDGRQQVLFAAGPARDFYLAAAAGLVEASKTIGEVSIRSYAFADEAAASQRALEIASQAMRVYEARYAPYPYIEFDIVPIVTDAGGVEFPGMTAIASDIYSGGMGGWMEIVVAHELGHQWFYNLVGNDNQDEPYLDESLVEFATWEYFRDRYGETGSQNYEGELRSIWFSEEPIPIGLPVSDYSSSEYVEIIYGRGAFFFAALRDRMGQAPFDGFMKAYVQQFSWGITDTGSFKALAEQECGCELTDLFEEWVYEK